MLARMPEILDKQMMSFCPVSALFWMIHKLETRFSERFCLTQVMGAHFYKKMSRTAFQSMCQYSLMFALYVSNIITS